MFIYVNKESYLYPKLSEEQVKLVLDIERGLLKNGDLLNTKDQIDYLDIIEEDIRSYWTTLEFNLYFGKSVVHGTS